MNARGFSFDAAIFFGDLKEITGCLVPELIDAQYCGLLEREGKLSFGHG